MSVPLFIRPDGSRGENLQLAGHYDTLDEATVAALDEMTPGDTVYVHGPECSGPPVCDCTPRTWTY